MNISLKVACNDYRNGSYTGRARIFTLEYSDGRELTLESPYVAKDIKFCWKLSNGFYVGRASRKPFKCGTVQYWVGNWCWDQTSIDEKTAERLCKLLKRLGYIPTSGTQEMLDWFQELNTKSKG